jgi:predicted transcriptional regulator
VARKKGGRPTDGELEILRVLWSAGASTVRQVHQTLRGQTKVNKAFNTTLKMMQIMHQKGIVLRADSRRPHVYRARVPAKRMQRRLVWDFVRRVFGGSAGKLVAAVAAGDITQEELAQIRKLLDEGKEKGHGRVDE